MLFCWVWWYCVPRLRMGFVPCVQKGAIRCRPVPSPFGGSFGGQICETDSHTHRSNKCAALVPLRNADTNITRFSRRKSPTNRYISFTLRQEVVRKHYSTPSPHTAPFAARNAPICGSSQPIGAVYRPAKYRPKIPAFRGFFILPQRLLPRLDFPVQVNPAQINN